MMETICCTILFPTCSIQTYLSLARVNRSKVTLPTDFLSSVSFLFYVIVMPPDKLGKGSRSQFKTRVSNPLYFYTPVPSQELAWWLSCSFFCPFLYCIITGLSYECRFCTIVFTLVRV
jgi:hypothetical protein